MVKRLSLHIVFLLITFGVFAQKKYVQLTITPQTTETGQPIKVTIKTNVDGKIEANLPGGFIQAGGTQSGMSTSIQIMNGQRKIVRNHIQSFTGYFKNEGSYLFGPITVVGDQKSYHSKSVQVKVVKTQNMISANPSQNMNKIAFGIIQQSQKTVYEGQPFVVEGKVYSQADIYSVKNYTPYNFKGTIEKHSLSQSNQVNISLENINGRRVQTFRIGKSVVFPSKVGMLTIQPFKTQIVYNSPQNFFPRQLNIVSNTAHIKVIPLPKGAPQSFINGVGKFNISANIHTHKILQGNVVELKLKLSGHGNLQNVSTPTLQLPKGLNLYGDTEVHDSLTYSIRGAEGSKTFTYFIQCSKAGDISMQPIKVAYFSPAQHCYKTIQCKIGILHVTPSNKGVINSLAQEEGDANLPHLQPYLVKNNKNKKAPWLLLSQWGSLLLFSPLMFGAVFGLFVRVKNTQEEKTEAVRKSVAHKEIALTKIKQYPSKNLSNEVIEEISHDFITFLSAQFHVSRGNISRAFLREQVPAQLSEQVYAKIDQLFNQLEAIRFGGINDASDIAKLKSDITIIIESFG